MVRKNRKKIRRYLIAIIAIAALAAVGFLLLGDRTEEMPVAAVREAVVTSNTYTQIIDISGYVEPYDSQTLRFRSTGAVTGVFVEEGDHVVKGQRLASIDNTQQLASLQEIRDQIEDKPQQST